jgi:ribonuclease-3
MCGRWFTKIYGEGSSRRFAEQAAAAEILKLLEQ